MAFDDVDNLPDASDKETNARDIYTRILVGGSVCNHFKEDGEKYAEQIFSTSYWVAILFFPSSLAGMMQELMITVSQALYNASQGTAECLP